MKFESTEVWGFEHALRGMRNPKNSWDRNDSVNCTNCTAENVDSCPYVKPFYRCFGSKNFIIGKNDMKLAQKLIRAGSEHRKFLRQIFVSVDITAPLYWFSEFDAYKVGTVANSTSKMHTLAHEPITMDCFETDDMDSTALVFWEDLIENLEGIRQLYNKKKDPAIWKELIRLLPESWLQKRTVTMNYENLLGMCSAGQRRYHKLNEWSGINDNTKPNFIAWARALPYAQEFIFLDEK